MNVIMKKAMLYAVLQCHMMTRVMNDEIQQALAGFGIFNLKSEFSRVFKPVV